MAKSLPPVSTKLIADAEQFIAEFRRAERAAQGSTNRVGAEVDRMAKSLSKKFSLGDIGKDLIKGFGFGSAFSIVDMAANQIAQLWKAADEDAKQYQETAKGIIDSMHQIARAASEARIAMMGDPKKELAARRDELDFVTKKIRDYSQQIADLNADLAKVGGAPTGALSGTAFDPTGGRYGFGRTMGSVGEEIAQKAVEIGTAQNALVKERITLLGQIKTLEKNVADESTQSAQKQAKELEEIGRLQAQTWGSMERNYQAALGQIDPDDFEKRRVAIEDMFYAGKIGAEAAARAIQDLESDQARWTKSTTEDAIKILKFWDDVLGKLADAGQAEALNNNLEDAAKAAEDAANEMGWAFQSAFEDAILQGEKLSDVLGGLAKDIARIVLRNTITAPLGNFISGIFKPRASGGPIDAGSPYLVGEQGPEMIVPRSSGTVIPNHKLGGSTYYIDARGADSGAIARLEATIRQLNGSIERRALAAVGDYRARGATA